MKSIIMAGGRGSRLYPSTKAVNKHLLPIYNKPMIYYPLSVLIQAGMKDVMIISAPKDLPLFQKLLGNGNQFHIDISYAAQYKPEGIAEAFIIGKEFIGKDHCILMLGDNLFFDKNIVKKLQQATEHCKKNYATIFCCPVQNPKQFGVLARDDTNRFTHIEEKPLTPKTNLAVTGLYCYPNNVVDYAATINKSQRGELEITDVNNIYFRKKQIYIKRLLKNTWFDTGTYEAVYTAAKYVKRNRQKLQALLEL